MILEHPLEIEFFKGDEGKLIDQLSTFLMGKIATTVGDSIMNMGNDFAAFLTFATAF